MADSVSRQTFVTAAPPILTPNAMVPTGHGGFCVSSVFNGAPQPPEVLADGLAYPDGIGIYQPTTRG